MIFAAVLFAACTQATIEPEEPEEKTDDTGKTDLDDVVGNLSTFIYIPKYSDNAERVKYTVEDFAYVPDTLSLKFDLNPKDAAETIAAHWQSVLSVRAVHTATKASAGDIVSMEVTDAGADDGILSVKVWPGKLDRDFIDGKLAVSISLVITSGEKRVASEYIPLVSDVVDVTDVFNYLFENYDVDVDGILGDDEFASITELNVSGMNLSSIDWILCKTPNLKTLDCSNNSITSLDLSACPSLETLNCSTNLIESLDASNNVSLVNLSCGHNQLAALDVSECPLLETLNCGDNQLTSLDVSNNTSLTTLDVSNNIALTTLDVSNNTALTTLDVSTTVKLVVSKGLNSSIYQIGQYVSIAGVTGVVCSASSSVAKIMSINETKTTWDYYGTTTGATSKDDGAANTDKIASGSLAAKWCRAVGAEWYLPAKNELSTIYDNKSILNTTLSAIGGTQLGRVYYWSSTEYTSTSAYVLFSNGDVGCDYKNLSYYVRAVRAL